MAQGPTVLRRPAPVSRHELWVRAQALAGRSVSELASAVGLAVPTQSVRAKGFVGQLVERALGADPRAGSGPDFPTVAVELKTVPIDARGQPTESTFCCAIDMARADRETWESSRLRRRLACVLWLPVTAARQAPLADRRFGNARLWEPNSTELALLQADWEQLMGAIGAGLGDSLRAHAGEVLQVRPKAAHARIRTWGHSFDDDGPQAVRPLGFYLRARFTGGLLREAER